MRDIILTMFTLTGLVVTVRSAYVGLLLWVLFSLMNPHQLAYGFARSIPWNLVIAIVTIAAWLGSSERKVPPRGSTTFLVVALLAWTTLNTFFAYDPSFSWTFWNRAWKIVAMGVLASILTTSRVRFHALMWVVALSLCYYGVKGGLFTLIAGGHSQVWGPPKSMIEDNNTLADALCMILPILNYLRLQSASRTVRAGIVAVIILVVTSIIGSYSREAYITLGVVAVAFWLRAGHKLMYPVLVAAVLVPLVSLMPEAIFRRFASIQQYQTDASFQSRVDSWWVSYRYAMDHLPFGAGFYGINLPGVWDQYLPGQLHASHSIYFQTLGEQGVIGLILYLTIIAVGFLNLHAVRRDTKGVPQFAWARDLADMMQLSLLAFTVGGAAAPINFFDLFFLWVMLSATLREMTRQVGVPATAPVAFAPPPGLPRTPLRVPPKPTGD
jgi:probable O-glycosylation ligase (exosortase A-associated)